MWVTSRQNIAWAQVNIAVMKTPKTLVEELLDQVDSKQASLHAIK